MLEEIIITTPDEVIDTIIKYGVTMDFMERKYFYTPSERRGMDKKQQLIDSVSYEDYIKFKEDYERKMERGEVEQVSLDVITHKYIMHKEYMFEVNLDYKTYHKLRQHIEFSMLI